MRAAEQYKKLSGKRETYLRRAREAASLTLPYIMPEEGTGSSTEFPTPFQSLGARGTNNLSSKLNLTLFPPNSPFFRLQVDPGAIAELQAQEGEEGDLTSDDVALMAKEIDESVSKMETAINQEIETKGLRTASFETFRHLIISGNCMWRMPAKEDGKIRVFHLDEFVVQRDPEGNILWMITKEEVDVKALDPAMRVSAMDEDGNTKKEVALYTAVERQPNGRFVFWQEVEGTMFNVSRNMDKGGLPLLALRMNQVSGESYGRGLIEEVLGDLISLEQLTRAIVQAGVAASHILYLVNPNGFTSMRDLQRARSGAFVSGQPADVQALQLQKGGDFQVALNVINNLVTSLRQVFLMLTPRTAERVTAEEIRATVGELEDALGGVYATLTEELQLPIVEFYRRQMVREGKLPELPEGILQPKVITGVEGLGRGQDLNRLRAALQIATETLGPQVIQEFLEPSGILNAIFAGAGVNPAGHVKSAEQVGEERQAAQEAAQQAQAIQAAGPEIAKQLGNEVQGQVNGQ